MDMEGASLKAVSRLDTCVTVVDASNLDVNLKSIQKVKVAASQGTFSLQAQNKSISALVGFQSPSTTGVRASLLSEAMSCQISMLRRNLVTFL